MSLRIFLSVCVTGGPELLTDFIVIENCSLLFLMYFNADKTVILILSRVLVAVGNIFERGRLGYMPTDIFLPFSYDILGSFSS